MQSTKWIVMILMVMGIIMVVPSVCEVPSNCDWLTDIDEVCVRSVKCDDRGDAIDIWEDCDVNTKLFTINDADISIDSKCETVSADVRLSIQLDVEKSKSSDCYVTGRSIMYFRVQNVNEFQPYPTNESVPTTEVYIKENIEPHVATWIYYKDDDYGETKNLSCELVSSDYDLFSLTPVDGDDDNIKAFKFEVFDELDFESQVFYKVEYDIISTDDRNKRKSSRQTLFIYVEDAPDNPPFWTEIVPVFSLPECTEDGFLFQVKAQDRDVEINCDIRYSMVEGDGTGEPYFAIDNITGDVSKVAEIDREELLENGITSFRLLITATEYKDDGTEGEGENSVEQGTTVTIQDCNDEVPTFDMKEYSFEMDELTAESGDQILNLQIVVKDMDEGSKGSFTLKTSEPNHLEIIPAEGKLSQDVELKAIYIDDDNNIFNYENLGSDPLTFTITATESNDPSNGDTANVIITLRDVNDNIPIFKNTTYRTSIEESKPKDSKILTVEADDDDLSDKFGKKSIRYSLESKCYQLKIDNTKGSVSLNVELDYDDKNTPNEIRCIVYARDNLGTGLQGSSEIVITVTDVTDETPWMQVSQVFMSVQEGSQKDVIVDNFTVNDADEMADIDFTIVSSVCSGEASKPGNVEGWFVVEAGDPTPPEYPANVMVDGDLDREACTEVTLSIMATDQNTDLNTDNVNGTIIITIEDKKDEPPEFVGSYDDVSFYEFDGNNPPKESVFVFEVTVSDPDQEDTINLAIINGDDKLELSENKVTVKEGEERKVEVWTRRGAMIDRETQETLEFNIELKNPNGQKSEEKFTIKIMDLNDNKPIMDPTFCNTNLSINEDDGTKRLNGTLIHKVKATDNDCDAPYNSVSYFMLNDQVPDNKGLRTPFTVNGKTGEVTVLLTEQKILDRETDQTWELLFSAFDQCRQSGDPGCTVQTSDEPCTITVTVMDVNDNAPCDISNIPEGDIKVTDFLKQNEDLGYQLRAQDDDEGINAMINYTVVGTYLPLGDDEDKELFYAENESAESSTCRLYANRTFQGESLTGTYNVILKATDGGGLSTNFNISVEVMDANDQIPYLVFNGCPYETEKNIIRMQENAYTPGEDGRPSKMVVNCEKPNGDPFIIQVRDEDKTFVNRESIVWIDTANSTVENAENEEEQLKYWSVEPSDCTNCYRLLLSHKIDREKGTAYNLKLYVKNVEETHKQESWEDLKVIVTTVNEFDPHFCEDGNCSQVVYMYENEADAETTFREAKDMDNTPGSPESEYEKIYYSFIGGDVNFFQLVSNTQRKIVLKNKPNGLDREDHPEYSLDIYASNDPGGEILAPDNTSNILHFEIRVGDKNDVEPLFSDDVIFTSFMSSNKNGDSLTTIKAHDQDLNETLTYTILDDLQWFDTEITPDTSFTLERNDPRSVDLKLDFDPKGMSEGYCNFTIRVEDAADHWDETQVKIYIINEDYQVRMYFSNTLDDVKNKENEIEDAYTEAYGYTCVIDSITPTQNTRESDNNNKTTVYMHFIDNAENEPVRDKTILDLSDDADVMKELDRQLKMISIILDSGNTYLPENSKSPEDQILMLQILLGVVTLVLGAFLVLLFTVYFIRTRSLTRKVKVLSTNTFGSKESGLNQMGDDMTNVPGSNLAKMHGNHNPVFSEDGAFEMSKRDTGSISSGDSIFVGVEDNPEFKNYSAKGGVQGLSRSGYENSSTARSIDEVSVPGVQGGVKGNPLLNLGSMEDPVLAVPNGSLGPHSFGNDDISQTESDTFDQHINSNFTFS